MYNRCLILLHQFMYDNVLFVLQLCVLGLNRLGMTTNTSAENLICLQSIVFQTYTMTVIGQKQTMRGHLSYLNMRLKAYNMLK
jgi:hypothetical protein